MSKIFGDTSLADFENERLRHILETSSKDQIEAMGASLGFNGLRLMRDLARVVLKMQPLSKELSKLYYLASTYTAYAKLSYQTYQELLENGGTQFQLQSAEDGYVTFNAMAAAEVDRVENSPEYLAVKAQLNEIYFEYEEILLALNAIVIPDEIAADYEP
jgi:hypothetical protein